MIRLSSGALLLLASSGCLDPTYAIEREELARLAQTPPEERGRSVRVTQELSFAQDPVPAQEAPRVRSDVHLGVTLAVVAHAHGGPPGPPHPPGAVHVAGAGGSGEPRPLRGSGGGSGGGGGSGQGG